MRSARWLLLALALPGSAQATEIGAVRPFGLGVILGEPTGISGKYYLDGRSHAVEAAIAWSEWRGRGAYLHATYLWHPSVLVDESGVEIPWNVGVGGFFGVWEDAPHGWRDDETYTGVRVPVGLDVDLRELPLQFFATIALDVLVLPGVDVDLSAGLGARWYF